MTDETLTSDAFDPPANKTVRTLIGLSTLGGTSMLIIWLMLYGKSDNSLHQSALSWAFTLHALILVGFGFGAALPLLAALLPKGK